MIFHLYPSLVVLFWLSLSLVGLGTNLILLLGARQARSDVREFGGAAAEYALTKYGRMVLRMGIHLSNFGLGLIALLTPPAPPRPSGAVSLLASLLLLALFAVHLGVVADGALELYSVYRLSGAKE